MHETIDIQHNTKIDFRIKSFQVILIIILLSWSLSTTCSLYRPKDRNPIKITITLSKLVLFKFSLLFNIMVRPSYTAYILLSELRIVRKRVMNSYKRILLKDVAEEPFPELEIWRLQKSSVVSWWFSRYCLKWAINLPAL